MKDDCFFKYQFISDEKLTLNKMEDKTATFNKIARTPIRDGTLSGVITVDNWDVQTFVVSERKKFVFEPIGNPEFYAASGKIDLTTGEISLDFNEYFVNTTINSIKVSISYEYDIGDKERDEYEEAIGRIIELSTEMKTISEKLKSKGYKLVRFSEQS